MKKVLPEYGIEVIEIPRCRNKEQVISATYVRKKFLEAYEYELEEKDKDYMMNHIFCALNTDILKI